MIYVGAGRSLLDKVYAFMLTAGTTFELHKIYLTDSAQWYENTAFAVATGNPTAMITTPAGCNTGKCDETRDLNRPTLYGELDSYGPLKAGELILRRSSILLRWRNSSCWKREHRQNGNSLYYV
jgi:hypothetical protein